MEKKNIENMTKDVGMENRKPKSKKRKDCLTCAVCEIRISRDLRRVGWLNQNDIKFAPFIAELEQLDKMYLKCLRK